MLFVFSSSRKQDNFLIIGGGSNILFTSDFHGTIIHPDLEGINVEEKKE